MTNKIDIKYILILFIAVFLSSFFHELTHWTIGEILGNKMDLSLNSVNPISGEYPREWNRNIVTISAPLFTIFQSIFFYFLINKYPKKEFYPFLFYPFAYRLFAGIANSFGPNDEGRFGLFYNIGLYTISIIVSLFLLFLVIRSSKKNKLSLKFNLINFLFCLIFTLFISFIDQYFHIKIIT